jgi:YgiT-type zinc finger domain-containing protein
MKCVICKHGQTKTGTTNVTLERNALLLVVKNVPAEICSNCGEAYLNDKTTQTVLHMAEEAVKSGVQVEICSFKAA